ncbi:NF-kappa-B essential modulator-like [Ostrea edulis]|uniref:NF-kappa-B essential modulator-like n=1 Tax=Ostrea edulis TaxID=37623 RepID=UPI0024AF2883|nr:NF-kappa-B essential modulator-like [Ostrea edulis]XP_048740269.2 NF-kappa-B essential modulator-like [Ostrea edulis]XP_048740270.2 NF-kappa-B essential modulator-like [Ostrea edulis]
MMNGTRTPAVVYSTRNGDVSYDMISPMPSSTRSTHEGSLTQGIGQISMTDINLEQALDRIQELHRENNELRDYLRDNNEKMKIQYQNLSEWKEKIRVNNTKNKEKFDQTREVVQSLTKENEELRREATSKAAQMSQLERSVQEVRSELKAKQEATSGMTRTIEELRRALESKSVSRSSDCLDTALVNTDSSDSETLKSRVSELEQQLEQFRDSNDSLLRDMESYKHVKQELQEENAKQERENAELSQKIETLLNENKGVKSEARMLRSRVEDLQEQMSRVQTSAVNKEEDRKTQTAEYTQSELGDLRQKLRMKEEEMARCQEQHQQHISKLTNEHQQERQELMQKLDVLQHELQQTKDEQTKAYTSDVQSLRSQVLTLITQVTELQNKYEAATEALDKKNSKVLEIEHQTTLMQENFQRQRAEDSAVIETLRLSLKSYEDALNAERKEHQNTKKISVDLRQSFNQLVSDHKNLSEKYKMQEQSRQQSGCTETEKQKLLDQIGRLTAQVYAGEEAINYREEKLKKVEEDNKKIKEELNNVVPVLKAQAEVWKSDFDAERDARERLHADKTQLEADFKQLQLRNQQLLDEMESFSKRQFQEMQQRHSNQGYQHSIQQHLRVGQQNHGSPYQFPHYPPQGYPSQSPGAGAMYNEARSPVAAGGQTHSGSQEGEDPQQFECPKCNQTCPDMDTLQIHVLDCIDQDNP